MKKPEVRLPKHIIPEIYDIALKPDLNNFTFDGVEVITLSILKETDTITLHSKEIQVITADIEKVFAKNITYNEKAETVSFLFPNKIKKGKHKLTIAFKGILNDKMRGFYRSKYTVNGKETHMATTQFEATDARKAFPCFDEPAHKAVFNVSLIVPKGKSAISNTLPISFDEHSGGYQIVKFAPTPKMSTYLLAFIVGDFEYLESKTKNGVLVRVYTTPGKKSQGAFALECAVKTLEFYEKYFAIKYPLNTLDMIAIPDFSSGAMENWGAVTYRESALLVDPKNSSTSNKQWVALVIAHEIAHQWFGNLVTMEWWTHLWLNEGFASYIEYLAVDKLFPQWDIWTQFTVHDLGVALRLDALASTHPIEVEVHHPDEIGEIFDEVSYSKGASVIRMLASYLGEKDFRDGLRYYLKKHSYQNTETIDLWQAFEKVSGKKVASMMQNWTSKPGYPVVKAEMKNGKIDLTQKRFFSSPIAAKKAQDTTKWEIPIVFGKNKVNLGEAGFFRTAYSKELLEKLRIPVIKKSLSARDRLGIIRDLFALAEAGTIPTTDALEFLSAYKDEDNYVVWVEIATGLTRIEALMAKAGIENEFNSFVISLFAPIYKKLGWIAKNGESHTNSLLRPLIISRLGESGEASVVTEARKIFAKSNAHVAPDIRSAVYKTIASSGSINEYNKLVERYKKEKLHEEKNRIGNALGYFKQPKILKDACAFAMSAHVRQQDSVGILSSVGANALGRDVWLTFIKQNWKTLVSRYGEGGLNLARSIKAISSSAEEKHLKDFTQFFATHPAPGAKRAIDQVKERLTGNIAWLKRDGRIIKEFFIS
jgi:puromycin-sensitive aminopeptidase